VFGGSDDDTAAGADADETIQDVYPAR